MLAYVFIVEGAGKIAGYAGVAESMQAHGGRPPPLVILRELGELSGCHEFGQGGLHAWGAQRNLVGLGERYGHELVHAEQTTPGGLGLTNLFW
ncbi:MAG TPA: hypothetical protein VFE60_26875 [Roseiarcus sp.]|jgi:uncharacterized membrane protein YphA (DoxX/SURF4 family)|nr:hypothetical protein [Roseiarcus sp.]